MSCFTYIIWKVHYLEGFMGVCINKEFICKKNSHGYDLFNLYYNYIIPQNTVLSHSINNQIFAQYFDIV